MKVQVITEEVAKNADIQLAHYTRDDFWKEIRAKKIITLGTPIEFQTVAYNMVPKISDGRSEVVSDEVAKKEYEREEKFSARELQTYEDFVNLMRSTGSWMKIDADWKYLGLQCPITIKFSKPYTSFKPTTDVEDVTVDVYFGEVKSEADFAKLTKNNGTKPIPVNKLFIDTYSITVGQGSRWFKDKNKTFKEINDNCIAWKQGKAKVRGVGVDHPLSKLIDDFAPKTANNLYTFQFPSKTPTVKITIPSNVKPETLVSQIEDVLIYSLANNESAEIESKRLMDILYDKNNPDQPREETDIVKSIEDEFDMEGGQETSLRGNADWIKNSRISFVNTARDNWKITKKSNDKSWVITLPSGVVYKIEFGYAPGDSILENGKIKIVPQNVPNVESVLVKPGQFFNTDLVNVQIKDNNAKVTFKRGMSTWWKAVVASGGSQAKQDIKLEKAKNPHWEEYWKRQNYIQEDNSEYWKSYWREMGF